MNILEDTLRLVASWRVYRRMEGAVYERLCADLALVIRSRVK
jgi:hypothetical protein